MLRKPSPSLPEPEARLQRKTAAEVFRLPNSNHSGQLLEKAEVDQKKEAGLKGVESLSQRLADRSAPLIGLELEFVVTDKYGDPAPHQGSELLEALKQMPKDQLETPCCASVTGELFRYQQEINPYPREASGFTYSEYEKDIRKYLELANIEAAKFGNCEVLMHGILPTQTTAHTVDSSLGSNPRYPCLVSGVETVRAMRKDILSVSGRVVANQYAASGSTYDTTVEVSRVPKQAGGSEWVTTVAFRDFITGQADTFQITNTSVLLAGVMTSMQSHLAVPRQEKYVGYHRAADLVTPLISALTVGEPLLFMRQAGAKGLRNFLIWQSATDPDRTAYTMSDWIDSPLGQIKEAQGFGPMFGSSAGKLNQASPYSPDEAVAIETAKTVWNINRTTLDVESGAVQLRIENRVAPCGPTVTDTVADAVVSNALIRMGYRVLEKALPSEADPSTATKEQMSAYLDFKLVKENMRHACVAGLEAEVYWAEAGESARKCSVRQLLIDEFLPGLADSLCKPDADFDDLTFDRQDIEHYISVIRDRLNFQWDEIRNIPAAWQGKQGCTSADVILYLDHTLQADFPEDRRRAQELVRLLKEAVLFDEKAFRKSEAKTGRGRGAPITQWMRERYGKFN